METSILAHRPVADKHAEPALRLAWLAGASMALLVYAATVAPDVLMMDYGEYQRSAWLFPHIEPPQGMSSLVRVHINYLMAAKVFGLLVPIGQWALRINLFSALAASIAVGNVCALAYGLARSKPAIALTWLAFTLGQTSWQYAVVAHVLPFQAATISAEILTLYLWATSDKFRWLLLLWTVNGLAAGAHVQNGLATPVYLFLLLQAWRQGRVRFQHVALCLGVWLTCFMPYLVFCLHEWTDTRPSGSALASMTMGSWGGRMWRAEPRVWLKGLLAILLNYPTGLALLYIPGVLALWRSPLPGRFRWGWSGVIAINLLFAMTYNVPDQQSFFVPAYAAASALIGLGAAMVLRNRAAWTAAFALAALVVPVYAFLPKIVRLPIARRLPLPAANSLAYRDPYDFYLKPWKIGYHNDRRYIEEALQAMPHGAIFYCSSTVYDGMKTVQVVEGERQDVTLNPAQMQLRGNIDVSDGAAPSWRRPVYCWSTDAPGVPRFLAHSRFVPKGIIWEVLPPENSGEILDGASSQSSGPR